MTSPSSRRMTLRSETAKMHAALEAVVGALDSRQAYVRYLRGLHAFRQPYEAALRTSEDHQAFFGAWRPTLIAESLLADITDLGAEPLPLPQSAPVVDRDRFLGALYVLEGSSLGARLLYRDALALGLTATFGARHLALQNENLETWRGFLALLDKAEGVDMATAAQAANEAFVAAKCSFLEVDAHGP